MLALIPFILFILLILIFHKWDNCWRSSALSAAIAWGTLLIIITEILSLFKSLTFNWVLGIWGLVGSGLCCVYLFSSIKKPESIARDRITRPSIISLALLLSIGLIFVLTGLIAIVSPANTWDSMTYHMSRVVHWIQNQGLAHYPTSILRQLHQNPWAEIAILHFQILSNGDRFANLIQWLSMIGASMGVSLIARQLGANLRGQIFSTVVSATIPMGILQASSTQNDYVVSFWLICFVYFASLMLNDRIKWTHLVRVGASLGLAILTKATAYIYAFPFLLWFILTRIKHLSWKSWKPIVIIAIVAVTINLGHYMRNFDLYGSPFGPGKEAAGFEYVNELFSIPALASNIIRNFALHIGTPIGLVNTIMERGIYLLHTLLSIDTNDLRTTWKEVDFHVGLLSNHEDFAGNPFHFLLIILTVVLCLASKRLRKQRNITIYLAANTAAFLLFSLIFKWQPWHSRLHLPLFILWSPFVAVVLSNIWNQKIINSTAIILILSALPWTIFNFSRPLFFSINEEKLKSGIIVFSSQNIWNTERIDQYFNNRPKLKNHYVEAAKFIKKAGCSDIGLYLGIDEWEYPLLVLLKKYCGKRARIEHVTVNNVSAAKSGKESFESFSPCVIISLQPKQSDKIIVGKEVFIQKWSSGPVNLFNRTLTE